MGGWRALKRLALLGCALLAGACATTGDRGNGAPFAPPAAGVRIVYRHATLIDGTDGPSRPDMAVVTNGPVIEAVVLDAGLTAEGLAGARVVDLTGRYLIPGLIDSHQHLATPPDRRRAEALMRRDLYSGITATRIMADDLRAIAELGRAATTGEIAGPDLYFAALVAGQSFFEDPRTQAISAGYRPGETPWAQAVDDRTDIPLAIARARGTGATGLKIYANLPPHLVRALTAEAHRQGLRVWAHAMVFPTLPSEVIAAGPDVVSHSCYLAYQLSDPPPQSYQQRFPVNHAAFAGGDNAVMAGLFREMRRRGIILDATLNVYARADWRGAAPDGRPYHCTLDLAARLTDQARREGVLISAGTDGDNPRAAPWPALFDELELLVRRAGMTPAEAIRAATRIGAMTIGQAEAMGIVQPGRLANFVILARDPTADIFNLRSVLFTVKRGRMFDRRDYRPITRQEVPDDD
jgi:cytosine/adenosine deaminase-related metal-dependent hydrolase